MRVVFLLIVLAFVSTSLNAQQLLNPYKGLWHYQNGNLDFQVVLWQDGAEMFGHFKMVEVNEMGDQINLVYTSRKTFFDGTPMSPEIYGGINELGLTGIIHDNTIANLNRDSKNGEIIIKLVPSCSGCGLQASWKIDTHIEVTLENEPPFNIPTDIVLTKISNIVPSNF